jgi:hypothetical protein
VRYQLWDPPDQIKIGLPNRLFGQVGLINEFSQIRTDNLRDS